MCSHYEAEFQDLLRGWGIPRSEWKNFADTYREWKEMKEGLGLQMRGIDPTKSGLVIKADGSVEEMHWGFMRARERKDGKGLRKPAPTVNARSEKISNKNSMWYESWSSGRRCIVPVSAFYEWTYPPGGGMVTHRFHMGGKAFGVAGLWEPSEEFGDCYTMLTTEPNAEVARTGHDRCLVVFTSEEEAERYLHGGEFKAPDFRRPDGMFQVESGVPNPRERKKKAEGSTTVKQPKAPPKRKKGEDPPEQGQLF